MATAGLSVAVALLAVAVCVLAALVVFLVWLLRGRQNGSPAAKPKVLVTGFGPFGGHAVNASWVAVQKLEQLGLCPHVQLVTKEIAVCYKAVQEEIPKLWKEHKPQLVVHVGVASPYDKLILETQACNEGYQLNDVDGEHPSDGMCVTGAPPNIQSQLDMNRVKEHVNKACCKVEAALSDDAGKFLCEFIYFTSLNLNTSSEYACARTAFIHVPEIDSPYSEMELAQGLKRAIEAMLDQVINSDPASSSKPAQIEAAAAAVV